MFLATLPGADQAQRLARLLEHAVIAHPGPWPATARGRALVLDCVPQAHQEILAPRAATAAATSLGQGTQEAGGQVLVPAAHPGQFVVGAAAKERGEHQPKDRAQHLSSRPSVATGPPPPASLPHPHRQARVPEPAGGAVRALARAGGAHEPSRAVAAWLAAVVSAWPVAVVCGTLGHGVMGGSSMSLLHWIYGLEETMTHFVYGFKNFHEA